MLLSKSERNSLFREIAESKLDPSEFEYRPTQDGSRTRIYHDSSGSDFQVEFKYTSNGKNVYIADRRVGDEHRYLREVFHDSSDLAACARQWADQVADWISVPELWELSRLGEKIPGDLSPDSANTPFTTVEQAAISAQLKEISESIKKTYALTAEQSAEIDKKFEQAEKASRRMGRKDWGLLFGGAVFSLILTDVITPGIAGHILMLVEHGIGHLFSGPPATGVLSAGQD
jgi:hypothetical protein